MLNTRELRMKHGITQKELAQKLNVPANTFNQWETGKRQPDNAMLLRIADFFNVSVDYLLGRTVFENIHDLFTDYDDSIDYGSVIKSERESQGKSIEDMSKALELTESDLEMFENGDLPVNNTWLKRFTDYLGTTPSQMLFDNGLYGGEVPERYHYNVDEWEKIKEKAEEEAKEDYYKNQKGPTDVNDDGLDDELVKLLCRLDDGQAQRAKDFVRGLLASREDEASRRD